MVRLLLYRNYKNRSDQELIHLYIEENCNYTLPIIYERYGHLVMGTCLKYLKTIEDSEDVTMELFAELPDLLKKYEITYFKSWLYQVVKHRCLKRIRNIKNREFYSTSDIELMDTTDDSEEDLEIQLLIMEQAVEQLPAEQRRCIQLFYIELKSYQEISAELEISLNQVKSSIQNGKRRLKIWIGEENEKR